MLDRWSGTALPQTPSLERLLWQASDAAVIVNESGTILFASEQACHLLKYAAGELVGQTIEVLIPNRNRLAHIGQRIRFADDRRPRPMGAGFALFALCKDGSERRVDISLHPVQRGLETLTVATIRAPESDAQAPAAK